jgi:predicted RNase H-like HicB family nuclease
MLTYASKQHELVDEPTSEYRKKLAEEVKDADNKKKTYRVLVEKAKGGGYIGRCLDLSGVISEGETLEELKENIVKEISLIRESILEEAHSLMD